MSAPDIVNRDMLRHALETNRSAWQVQQRALGSGKSAAQNGRRGHGCNEQATTQHGDVSATKATKHDQVDDESRLSGRPVPP